MLLRTWLSKGRKHNTTEIFAVSNVVCNPFLFSMPNANTATICKYANFIYFLTINISVCISNCRGRSNADVKVTSGKS